MSKSKFAESIQGLSQDQLDRIAADVVAEQSRRGVGADDFARASQMSDREFEEFRNRVFNQTEAGQKLKAIEAAAAKSGKVLVDPAAKQEPEKNDDAAE